MGHASGKKNNTPEKITSLERDNSEYDSGTEHCIQEGGPSPPLPYPGYRAILKLDGRFVNTYFRVSVECANISPAMIEYVKDRLDIDDTIFHSINWTSI